MADKLHLRLVSPTRLVYEGDVDMAIIRTTTGDIGILAGHENLTTILSMGLLRLIDGDQEQVIAVLGGFCEVSKEGVTILSDLAELTSDIDTLRADQARIRAEERIRNAHANSEIDIERAELALKRAFVRLEAAKHN